VPYSKPALGESLTSVLSQMPVYRYLDQTGVVPFGMWLFPFQSTSPEGIRTRYVSPYPDR
jgi:hypothetical protein